MLIRAFADAVTGAVMRQKIPKNLLSTRPPHFEMVWRNHRRGSYEGLRAMNLKTFLCAMMVCVSLAGMAMGQGLFGAAKSENQEQSTWWTGDKSGNRDSSSGPFSGWKLGSQPGNATFTRPFGGAQDDSSEGGMWNWGRPAWLPERDPAAPSMFSQWGERSRDFWQRTNNNFTEWRMKTGDNFRNAGNNFRETTSATWAKMTNGISRPGWMGDAAEKPRPPLRKSTSWFGGGS